MKKDRKIKVLDGKKWVIKIFASLGVFIITLLIIFNTIDANENQDTFMLLFLISFAIVIVYWIYSYKTSKKYVSIEEYLKINKNIADVVLRQELSKQGFNENEVEFILTGKSLERFKDNEFAEVSEVSRVNENEVNKLKGGQEVHHCHHR